MSARQDVLGFLQDQIAAYQLAVKSLGIAERGITRARQNPSLQVEMAGGHSAWGYPLSSLKDAAKVNQILISVFSNTKRNLEDALRDVARDRGFMTGSINWQPLISQAEGRLNKHMDALIDLSKFLDSSNPDDNMGAAADALTKAAHAIFDVLGGPGADVTVEEVKEEVEEEYSTQERVRRAEWWYAREADLSKLEVKISAASKKLADLDDLLARLWKKGPSGYAAAQELGENDYRVYRHTLRQMYDFVSERIRDARREHLEGKKVNFDTRVVSAIEEVIAAEQDLRENFATHRKLLSGLLNDTHIWVDPSSPKTEVEDVEVILRALSNDLADVLRDLTDIELAAVALRDPAKLYSKRL